MSPARTAVIVATILAASWCGGAIAFRWHWTRGWQRIHAQPEHLDPLHEKRNRMSNAPSVGRIVHSTDAANALTWTI